MKTCTVIFSIFLSCLFADAQASETPKHELHLSYGFASDALLDALTYGSGMSSLQKLNNADWMENHHGVGPVIAGFNFYVTKRISVGPELNILKFETRWDNPIDIPTFDRFFLVNLSARFDYHYITGETFQMYSGFALGVTHLSDKRRGPSTDNPLTTKTSYQVNLLGIRIGTKWAGFGEIGYGRNGFFSLGVCGRI